MKLTLLPNLKMFQSALIFVATLLLCQILLNITSVDKGNDSRCNEMANSQKAKYWFYHSKNDLNIFQVHDFILTQFGMEQIIVDNTLKETFPDDWNLLWSYEHQSKIPYDWRKLKFHQKINHLPGNHHLCSKSKLGSSTDSKYVPKAFLTVEDVKEYSKTNPNKRFVVKRKSNRGVILQNVTEMNFVNQNSQNDFFAVEFIENPLLLNGHKFDFGVYVIITSINPLRLYYYTKNVLIRACPKTYDTSDPEDRDRYVVKSNHIPGAKFPGIKEYYDNNYTYRDGFDAFLRSIGPDVEAKVWADVENLIRSVVLSKEKDLIKEMIPFAATKNSFFEMVRFDLFLDSNLNLYVFEINQTPNMYPSRRIAHDRSMHESVLFNVFNLIGVGKPYKNENFMYPIHHMERIVVHTNSLTVNPGTCLNLSCNESCELPECELCWKCLKNNQRYDLLLAYEEQMNIGDFKRLFPPKRDFLQASSQEFTESLEPESKFHAKWFLEMCKKNEKFC